MDGGSKRPYTIRGTERFATSGSQGSADEQPNRGHAEAAPGQARAAGVRRAPGPRLRTRASHPWRADSAGRSPAAPWADSAQSAARGVRPVAATAAAYRSGSAAAMAAACRLADASGQAVRYPATARRTSGSSRPMGIGAAIAGVILDRCGYVPNVEQSAAAIRGILLMAGLIPAVGPARRPRSMPVRSPPAMTIPLPRPATTIPGMANLPRASRS